MPKTYKSEALAVAHEMAEGLFRQGHIDKTTMRAFDEGCLTKAPSLSPEQIKAIREYEHVSQSVFARHLNVSTDLISEWERSLKRLGGPALRLLSVVRKNGLSAIA